MLRHASVRSVALSLVLGAGLVGSTALVARAIKGPSPATPPPVELHGELVPAWTGSLPNERDNTDFDEFRTHYTTANLFEDLDFAGDRLIVAQNWGLTTWTLADPANPVRGVQLRNDGFPIAAAGEEAKEPVRMVSVPPGRSDVAALACGGQMGFVAVDLATASVLYQDHAKSALDVATGIVGGRAIAYFVHEAGVEAYDLDAALAVTENRYAEIAPDAASHFPNVHLGSGPFTISWTHPTNGTTRMVPPSHVAVAGDLVVTSHLPGGVRLWRASDPIAPVELSNAFGTSAFSDVEIWRDGARTFVAGVAGPNFLDATLPHELVIFEVVADALGAPVGRVSIPWGVSSEDRGWLRTSVAADGTRFLSMRSGAEPLHEDNGSYDPSRIAEMLFDVSAPNTPREVMPPVGSGTARRSYWAHSYRYGWSGSGAGRWRGEHYYRVTGGTLEVHHWATPPVKPDAGVPTDDGGAIVPGGDGGTTVPGRDGSVAARDAGDGGGEAPLEGGCACRASGAGARGTGGLGLIVLAFAFVMRRARRIAA